MWNQELGNWVFSLNSITYYLGNFGQDTQLHWIRVFLIYKMVATVELHWGYNKV